MIKFDRDVHQALKTLERNGFETYAYGQCVCDSLRGFTPIEWDLISKVEMARLQELFPEGEKISDQILRLDFTYENEDEDGEKSLEGVLCDVHILKDDIISEVKECGFTCYALADNPERQFVDPWNGKDDIQKKLVKTGEDAREYFSKNPMKMMEAVRIAAETGFDLHKSVYEGILANWRILLDKDVDGIREEFERIITGDFAGKGLSMMSGTGLMAVILGEELSKKISSSEMQSFNVLCENIDKTKPVRLRRLGLLYTCFSKKKGLEAIERLGFDENSKMYLDDGMKDIIKIQFLGNPKDFKRYLFEKGMDRYNYLHNLSKAQRIVFDQPTTKIESRNHMMREIINMKEAVFVEDLVIDENDLMAEGIADTPERAYEILEFVIAKVHENPKYNEREYLLKAAKKMAKSKFAAKTRYVRWLK